MRALDPATYRLLFLLILAIFITTTCDGGTAADNPELPPLVGTDVPGAGEDGGGQPSGDGGAADDGGAVLPDGGCVPACTGRCCGPDGCGGTCPDRCGDGAGCDPETCTCGGVCPPVTCLELGRDCGDWPDGCGSTVPCGVCPADQHCAEGVCREECEGSAIPAGGQLDVDLKSVRLTGSVRLAGAALPDETGERGTIVFSETRGGGSLAVPLKAVGAFSYAVTLAPGVYDVSYQPNPALCGGLRAPQLPCNGGPLLQGVRLVAHGVLDVDIPVATLQGRARRAGGDLPDASDERGALAFTLDGGGTATTHTLGRSGAAVYEVSLLPGTYTVSYVPNAALCGGESTPPLPCIEGPLRSGVPVGADGVLDVDVPAVRVNGRVTLRGAALPDAEGDRGALRFALRGGGVLETRRLGDSGAGAYALSLLPGTYDVHWTGNALCDGRRFAPVPCNAGPVRAGVAVHQDAALDVDLPLVRVQGAVEQGGGPLPDADGPRGHVSFTLAEGGSVASPDFGPTGAAAYSLSLLPGEYTIEWSGNALCGGDDPPPLPCNRGPLHAGKTLTTDGVLDLDVPVARIRGMVRLDGGLLPDAAADRGSATFTLVDGGPVSTRAMGADGDSDYALSVLPGVYDVSWNGNPGLCDGRSPAPLPCNGGPVREGLSILDDGVLDVDVPSTRVQGRVTLDGGSLPSAPGDRGQVTFTRVGGTTASIGELGLDGPRDYALTLVHGRYLVRHEANAGLCDGTQAPAVPCVSAVVLGCTAP